MDNLEIDYKKVAQQLRSGEALFGKDGALAPMLERILNAALKGEMDAHLNSVDRSSGNRRGGKMSKTVQTKYGEVTVEAPRDRDGSFKSETVEKYETILAEGMADQIINMYTLGTGTRDISKYFEREFNITLLVETISFIADRILPEITAWKLRMLDPVYAICWLNVIHYKVRDDKGRAATRAMYNVLSINKSGHKDLLGMYIPESEGTNFWPDVMTDLQNCGVRDILICCADGPKRSPDAIQSVFPETSVQLCIICQIRNSIKYVGSKYQKEFLKDLKTVYGAVSRDSTLAQLDMVDEKWSEIYPIVVKSWCDNRGRLTEYFQYTPAIRKLIYTTNTVKSYHRQVRKVTKNKDVLPSDTAPEKLVYLAYRDISGKWTMPLSSWALISQQLVIKFGGRFKIM